MSERFASLEKAEDKVEAERGSDHLHLSLASTSVYFQRCTLVEG
jgi:hypothetical protein